MNKKSYIFLNPIKYREEDFGYLASNGNNCMAVNSPATSFIDYLNSCKKGQIDTLITNYLCRFKFDSNEDKDDAYQALLNFLDSLLENKLIGVIDYE